MSVLFTSILRMQNNCHLFSLVDSADEIKATKGIAYLQIFLYSLSTIMLMPLEKKKGSIFSMVDALSKLLIDL